jgi:hypothetical protein
MGGMKEGSAFLVIVRVIGGTCLYRLSAFCKKFKVGALAERMSG